VLTEDALGLFSIESTVGAHIARSRLSLYFIFSVRQSFRYDQSASVIQVWSLYKTHWDTVSVRHSTISTLFCQRGPWGEILDPKTAYFNIVCPFFISSYASKSLFLKLWHAYHYRYANSCCRYAALIKIRNIKKRIKILTNRQYISRVYLLIRSIAEPPLPMSFSASNFSFVIQIPNK